MNLNIFIYPVIITLPGLVADYQVPYLNVLECALMVLGGKALLKIKTFLGYFTTGIITI